MTEKNTDASIDPADLQQDSPAEAEAEVTDPDGNPDGSDEENADGLQVGAIGQTGIVSGIVTGGGTGLGRV